MLLILTLPPNRRFVNIFSTQHKVACFTDAVIYPASVLCRYLGYYGSAVAHSSAYYGQGSGYIVLDDVRCGGYESSFFDCANSGWGQHNCQHHEDASVTCSYPGQ